MRLSPRSLGLAVLALASCGAPRGPVSIAPADFPGFPAQRGGTAVRVEGTFYTNHSHVFGTDLTFGGILPVAVRVGIGAPDGRARKLSAASLDAHLYLQDGTVLAQVPPERIEHRRVAVEQMVVRRAVTYEEIPAWDEAAEGFLYFRFEAPEVRVEGNYALSRPKSLDGRYPRELELQQSLVGFTVETPDGPELVFVGLQGGYHGSN